MNQNRLLEWRDGSSGTGPSRARRRHVASTKNPNRIGAESNSHMVSAPHPALVCMYIEAAAALSDWLVTGNFYYAGGEFAQQGLYVHVRVEPCYRLSCI
eukprot:4060732-Pyramimonas_sp.AAC.1